MDARDCLLPMAGWIRNQVREEPAALRRLGPLLKVKIQLGNGPALEALAVFNTSAPVSRLCPDLVKRLLENGFAGAEQMAQLTFHNGTQAVVPLVSDPNLSHPHDISIGLDLLSRMRLVLDFVSGNWEFHIAR
jgi:hypothetical protein